MRRWMIVVIAVLCFAAPGFAQEDSPVWYLAVEFEAQSLMLYTAEGENLSLPTTFSERAISGLVNRVDNETFLLQIEAEEERYQLMLVSPAGLEPIEADLTMPVRPIDYRHPYVLMIPIQPMRENPILLVNLAARTAHYLELPFEFGICCRFSQDGATLRYGGVIVDRAAGTTEKQIRAVDLATGAEQTLLTTGPQTRETGFSSFLPNSDGTRWLERQLMREPSGLVYRLRNIDGTLEMEDMVTAQDLRMYRFWGDQLLRWTVTCEQGCTLDVLAPGGETLASYALDGLPEVPVNIQPLQITDETLIFQTLDELIELRPNAPARVLGYLDFRLIGPHPISLDGRFITVVDNRRDPMRYGLWDNDLGRFVIDEARSGQFILVRYAPTAALLWEQGRDEAEKILVYDASLHRASRIQRPTERGSFGELVSGEQVIYLHVGEDEGIARGLYLYDFRLDRLTLLVEGLYRPLGGEPLETIALFAARQ